MSTKVAVGVYVRQMNTIELNSGLQASLSIDPGAVRVSVPNTIDDTGMLGTHSMSSNIVIQIPGRV